MGAREKLSRLGVSVKDFTAAGETIEPEQSQPGDTFAILYTSGTTGLPKGVLCPHAQFFWFGVSVGEFLELNQEDILFTTLPLFHTNALTSIFQAMLSGASLVIDEKFSASQYWKRAVETGATCGYLLGAMIAILCSRDSSEYRNQHKLRRVLAPATPMDIGDAFRTRYGVELVDSYASTESNAVIGTTPGAYRPGYMGIASPDYELRVVDSNGLDVSDGEAGELLCRSKYPFAFAQGYVNNAEATSEAWRDSWFHTGDRVVKEKDWYRFVDRLSDSIRRRGENISSLEVENAVLSHPDVSAAAAFAVPSQLAEDEVMISVQLVPRSELRPDNLIEWVTGRLPYFAVPRYVEFVSELPVTASGKINKNILRDRGVLHTTWDRESPA